ncbi:MAG: L-aspartate oxidase [Candidatus Eisenbacteria bacterium]|uniref:L-aspartate oxidase n=1 Tax=Eiseniibacteriota bacterium TaxID=2212470 RepID=A0A956NBI0_UNCEI|nr:L-aspartate oxidase [Candidatus Eisenbacteria bacterium]MCB9462811.1 L-aspartate oxidase [Candidatus Eisenbacteria bacterium]
MYSSDFLVIGSGLASLVFALRAADEGPVTIVTKRQPFDGNTGYAQGGIAAPLGGDADFESHVQDTLSAGAGLCDEAAVRSILADGPAAVARLDAAGVPFSRDGDGSFALGREGGHTHRRILHVKDHTGRAIQEQLLSAVRAHPRIQLLADHCAVDLIVEGREESDVEKRRCVGAYVLDSRSRKIEPYGARVTFLATGGTGKVYRYTSNSDIATGDGIAMAYRAGCRVQNLEFVQFHPTCLYHPDAKDFLISEAVRGEGAFLTTLEGDRLEIPHPMGDLAPRDIVARAIDRAMKRQGARSVLLHMEELGASRVRERFPTIYETCLRYAIDITREPIPVVPAAHYQCGGVLTDLAGRTDLRGLLAAGEVSCTGLHGANRLASNSLLEATVMGARAATTAIEVRGEVGAVPELEPWDSGSAELPRETVLIDAHWDLVRTMMWEFVGIVRTDHRLGLAARYLEIFRNSIEAYYWDFVLDQDLIELRNLALVAELIIQSARARKESRGLHYNEDHPETDAVALPTVVSPLEPAQAAVGAPGNGSHRA